MGQTKQIDILNIDENVEKSPEKMDELSKNIGLSVYSSAKHTNEEMALLRQFDQSIRNSIQQKIEKSA